MNFEFFKTSSYEISELITKRYSTSFSLATSLLEKDKRAAIYATYGFVRLADEIVDSFHDFDKKFLLNKLNEDLEYAIQNGISTNTVLVAFSDTVHKYNINRNHINAFMKSMEADLHKTEYTNSEQISEYIYGSADVVGLMCLKIFCNGDEEFFQKLKEPAQKLGSAFQKVNFLRDLKNDINNLGRTYFPELVDCEFCEESKKEIEQSIKNDFDAAYEGIIQLPGKSKLAVLLAYNYYLGLFRKIKSTPANKVIKTRIRISNFRKYIIFMKVMIFQS